jgi:endogenous inhibitor of DNA gyrase (YacG/DUF329 family)
VDAAQLHITEACPTCGRDIIAVLVRTAAPVVAMRSCNRCDLRWWTADGRPADPLELFARA